jgi:hypothetical protein
MKSSAEMVDTTDEWIMTRIGIRERHILKGPYGPSELGAEAIRELLAKTNTQPRRDRSGDLCYRNPRSSVSGYGQHHQR